MVASVAAYIDFYRPKYGLLENVMNMAQTGRGRDEDALSQLISTVVGMGYQLQLFVVDAWSCGNPQSRTRLFVSFVAPGLELLNHPVLSHSHPPHITDRGLGQLANGQPFGRRLHELTAFDYVSAAEATKDLPDIGNGKTNHCTEQPDHIVAMGVTCALQAQIEAIPRSPPGMNFRKTWESGFLSAQQRALFPTSTRSGRLSENVGSTSVAWGRVDPEKLFPTLVVHLAPADARGGTVLHWDNDRPLTTMEGRRAQGFPDDEVLLGNRREAWKLLGNSVARNVAVSLGLSLREAWLKCNLKKHPDPPPDRVLQENSISDMLGAGKSNVDGVSRRNHQVTKLASLRREVHKNHDAVPMEPSVICSSGSHPARSHRRVAPNKARRTRPAHELPKLAFTETDPCRPVITPKLTNSTCSYRIQKSTRQPRLPSKTLVRIDSDDELSLATSDVRFRSPDAQRSPVAKRPRKENRNILFMDDDVETTIEKDLKQATQRSEDSTKRSAAPMKKVRRVIIAQPVLHARISSEQERVHRRTKRVSQVRCRSTGMAIQDHAAATTRARAHTSSERRATLSIGDLSWAKSMSDDDFLA
ncbi:hypothetical protein K3495_g8964 [Podosphaera aphanis]|nr:hypothetical protein K3495_g8964 [Podosphaera aphanis]